MTVGYQAKGSDPIASYMLSIQSELKRELDTDNSPNIGTKITVSQKLKPEFCDSDRLALEQVKGVSDRILADIFGGAMVALDNFYSNVRIPRKGPNGELLKNAEGRQLWEKNEAGVAKTDWSTLNGAEIETALFEFTEIRLMASMKVKELYQEALFAKMTYDDAFQQQYSSVVEGTVKDREARANRMTQDEKYNHWLRYYIWDMANTFLQEIDSLMWLLKNVRGWHIAETER